MRDVTLLFALVLGLLVSLGACGYTGIAGVAHDAARHDYRCPADSVSLREIRRNTFDVDACGHAAVYQCHGYHHRCADLTGLARKRAAVELPCSGTIDVSEVNPHLFAVRGCGKKAMYHCEMRDGLAQCALEREPSDA